MALVSDARRGVMLIERRERARHEAKEAAAKEEIIKAAQSK